VGWAILLQYRQDAALILHMGADRSQIGDLEQRLRQLLLLQETVKKVSSILDLERLLDEIVGSIAETFGCNRAAVVLKDDWTDELVMFAFRGFADIHLLGHRFKIGGEGMVGHVGATGKMRYAPDVRKDPYYFGAEPSTLSEVDIPLISRGKLIGVFSAQSSVLDAFSPEQIQLLCALVDNIAIAVENARLFKQERLEKEKGMREQEEARSIQRALLPDADPVVPGYALDGFCLQLNAVGGDWYDFVNLADGVWGVALGDVCGKGMAAALLMAAARSLLRRIAAGLRSPSEVLTKLNEVLVKDLPHGRFVTMSYLVLDACNHLLTVANAGHPYPLHMSNHSGARALETVEGRPLGMMASAYSELQVKLEPGDRVLVYSDGLAEATGSLDEEYSTSRLIQILGSSDVSAREVIADVQRFTGGHDLPDDATAIVIRRQ
jgi:sigma-B regulation protein RsbU (phosphoserine phosphatase)